MIDPNPSSSTSELSPAHVRSGKVMTVRGAVPLNALGTTLMHEHLLLDAGSWWHRPNEPERVHAQLAGACRHHG
jgi:phosphotriesterase-related protein